MLGLLERPTESVQFDLRNPLAIVELEMSIRNRRVLDERVSPLESGCRTELKALQAELDQLLAELSQSLKIGRP
ncbi:hypothetical protein [Cohnella cholangitidis]|uniref:Uncharacterized protein n=1 Tax=Cohnella cholangitidis TaxID=2598458 RepID=A0A7G5BZR3_9BACL|nr:hypothetical protein [Cohnella cholangitidis]QMV42447.1 hypothetical protein FPL14_15505 [Cohnella cholangitidis]